MGISLLTRLWQKFLIVWIFIPELFSITISREDRQRIICADLELLQYDIMYGKQYVYKDSGAPITEGHMVMGVKDATITSVVEQLKGTYSIYGENFTKQSKVYINGEKQTTKFLNNTRLDLKESEIKDGDQIMVAQCGSSNTIFRTSKTYEYTGGQLVEVTDQDTDVENGRQAFVEQKEEKKK